MSREKSSKRWRRVDGIVLLDKPAGISSNQALQRVRHALMAEKGGHTGALDPLATGMLPLCFGEATKIAGLLLGSNKVYETLARLGVQTDTADAEGQVIERRAVPSFSDLDIEGVLQTLTGKIQQVPPIYSALKRDGEPLYAKARRGEVVEVQPRPVEVFEISTLARGADWVKLRIRCGSGTYVRSLVRDMGERLGCGAHVETLRRNWVAPFEAYPMHTLDDIQQRAGTESSSEIVLYSIEHALADYPSIQLDDAQQSRVRQGQTLRSVVVDSTSWPLVAIGPDGRAVALMEADPDGGIRPSRVFAP